MTLRGGDFHLFVSGLLVGSPTPHSLPHPAVSCRLFHR